MCILHTIRVGISACCMHIFSLQWMIQARTLAMIHCDDPMMHVTVMAAIRDYVLSCVCCFAHIFPIELV